MKNDPFIKVAGKLHHDKVIYRKAEELGFVVLPSEFGFDILGDRSKTDALQELQDLIEMRTRHYRATLDEKIKQPFAEGIRRIIADINKHAEFDYNEVKQIANKFHDGKRASVGYMLIQMIQCVAGDLTQNLNDNRIWHPFAQLPTEIKAVIKAKDLPYLISLDIRSCYPRC